VLSAEKQSHFLCLFSSLSLCCLFSSGVQWTQDVLLIAAICGRGQGKRSECLIALLIDECRFLLYSTNMYIKVLLETVLVPLHATKFRAAILWSPRVCACQVLSIKNDESCCSIKNDNHNSVCGVGSGEGGFWGCGNSELGDDFISVCCNWRLATLPRIICMCVSVYIYVHTYKWLRTSSANHLRRVVFNSH